jgi:protein TonB
MQEPQKRMGIALALLCSLLGHGVLLFAMPLLLPPMPTPQLAGTMEVSLRAGEAQEQMQKTPASLPETPIEAVPKPIPAPPVHAPAASRTPVISTPTPAPEPSHPAAMVNTEPVPEVGGSPSPTTLAAAQPAGSAESVGVGGASQQGATSAEGMNDALQDYRFAIGSAARKFKRYPALSRERGREGRVEARLIWRPGMRVPQVELHSSAGDKLLDEQGLSMLRQAAEQTPLPPVLRERAFSLVLPIEFSLKDVN